MSHDPLESLHCWSLSAKEGDAAPLRERATIKQQYREETLTKWSNKLSQNEGLFYLATCHRVELYAWTATPTATLNDWVMQSCKSGCQTIEMHHSLKHLQGQNALAHLIRVCAGLESEVLGETQILGQVKDAVRDAKEAHWLRGPIDRTTQMAFRVAKKIRSQTRIGEGTVSIAHAAIEGLSDVFEDFTDKTITIVGAGTMALQSLEKLWSLGSRNITWINRSLSKIQSSPWAERVTCRDLSHLVETVAKSNISILATRAEEPLITRAQIDALPKGPRMGPQILLDLGLPRNVAEDVHGLRNFIVRNVDEFSNRSMKGHAQRAEAVPNALRILDSEMAVCLKDWNHYLMAPAKRDLMLSMQELKSQTLRDLQLDKASDLEYVIHSIYAKLSHRLLEELDQVQDEDMSQRVLEIINRAWRRPQTNGSQKETQYFEKGGAEIRRFKNV